jgi:hypothetical protein
MNGSHRKPGFSLADLARSSFCLLGALAGALPPQPLEPVPRDARVVRRVLSVAAPARRVSASSFWTPTDCLGDGFDAPPLCYRQGQVLAQPSQALEELSVPAAEAPLLLQESVDPLPRGHTFALPCAGAPLSRPRAITPGLIPPRS